MKAALVITLCFAAGWYARGFWWWKAFLEFRPDQARPL